MQDKSGDKLTDELSGKAGDLASAKGSDKDQWWSKGIRFQCQGSGKCCTSHGEFG